MLAGSSAKVPDMLGVGAVMLVTLHVNYHLRVNVASADPVAPPGYVSEIVFL
jgi:hypothetical protein